MNKKKYSDYLQSPEWREKKRMILDYWDNRCAICNSDYKVELHHRSYKRVGKEKFTDLIPLCKQCHQNISYRDSLKAAYIALLEAFDYELEYPEDWLPANKFRGDSDLLDNKKRTNLELKLYEIASQIREFIDISDDPFDWDSMTQIYLTRKKVNELREGQDA